MSNKETSLPCGCIVGNNVYKGENLCGAGKRLFQNWQKSATRFERLQTRGNELDLERTFKAFHQHFETK